MRILKLFLVSISLLYGNIANGQLFLQPQLPPTGLIQKSQIWNFTVLNPQGQDYKPARIEVLISDFRNNRKLLQGTTGVITISNGSHRYSAAELGTINYSVFDASYGFSTDQSGFIPAGMFSICYAIVDVSSGERIVEQCESLDIDALNPPALQTPDNYSKLEEKCPVFTWLPPTPLQLFPQLTYDLKVVAVESTQSAQEALRKNIPVYEQKDAKSTQSAYPPAFPRLDVSKTYAWQVIAKNGGKAVSGSETWTFSFVRNAVDTGTTDGDFAYYPRLQKEWAAGSYLTAGTVRFLYVNDRNEKTVHLNISDVSKGSRSGKSNVGREMNVRNGDNYLQIDLSAELETGHVYLLELLTNSNERWYLKFEYRANKN